MPIPPRSRRRQATAALGCASILFLAACSSGADSSSNNGDGGGGATSLRVLVPAQGDVLDPTRVTAQGMAGLLPGIEPLLRYKSDGSLNPALAEDMQQPDPTTYVFTLRQGVTFWDGSELTADDVVFSFDLQAAEDSESLNHPFWTQVESIESTADNEVTVTLAQPDPSFPYTVAYTPIVSQAFYETHPDGVGTPETLTMGTGPYEFTSFTPSRRTEFKANEDYWGKTPAWDELVIETVGDDSARLSGVQSGEFDAIYNIPIAQLDAFTGLDGLSTAEASDLLVYKFNFDTTKPPFDDVHLRRAFMHAVDRADLVAGALGGRAELAQAVVPQDFLSVAGDAAAVDAAYDELESDLSFDLDLAREELAQSSSPDGVSVDLLVTASDPNLSLIAQTAAQTLAEIGITLNIKQVDDNSYYEAVYFTHQTDGVSLDGFSGPNPAPITMPLYTLNSAFGLPKGGQGSNLADYDSPEVDALLEQAAATDPEDPASIDLILQALSLAQQDAPYVPIAFPEVYVGARDGIEIGEFDTFWWMTDWPSELTAS